jgi:hypothetical protein
MSDWEEWEPVVIPYKDSKDWDVEISDELWERWLRVKAEFEAVQRELRQEARKQGVEVAEDDEPEEVPVAAGPSVLLCNICNVSFSTMRDLAGHTCQ